MLLTSPKPHFVSQLQSAEGLGSAGEAMWQRAKVLLARGQQESWLQLCLEGARIAVSEQPCLEADAGKSCSMEPYAPALPGFRALQAHLGLSRHGNPVLISLQHFLLLLSRLAFLLPLAYPGALSYAWGSQMVP